MGSSLSKISDDIDDYEALCKMYGEVEQGMYGNHYDWLNDKHDGKTTLSFAEYDLDKRIKTKNSEIQNAKDKLSKLEKDIIKLEEELKLLNDGKI